MTIYDFLGRSGRSTEGPLRFQNLFILAVQERKRASRLIGFRGLCPLSFACAFANHRHRVAQWNW